MCLAKYVTSKIRPPKAIKNSICSPLFNQYPLKLLTVGGRPKGAPRSVPRPILYSRFHNINIGVVSLAKIVP